MSETERERFEAWVKDYFGVWESESQLWQAWQAARSAQPAQPQSDDEEILRERDEAEEWADRLAYAIGEHFGVSVGEHSNCNDPRAEALKILNGEYVTLDSLRDALYVHWLSEMVCNHEAKTDVSRCACGQFESKPQPNVGEAVKRWVEHVYRSVGFEAGAQPAQPEPPKCS